MSNKQQTAVEYMFGLLFNPSLPKEEQFKIFQQAKELEYEQLYASYTQGCIDTEQEYEQ